MSDDLPEVRVGDRERREVDARLQAALADGVLTLSEYDERAGQCWAARTRSELDVLVRDLPGPAGGPATAAGGEGSAGRPLPVPETSRLGRVVSGVVTAALVAGGAYAGAQVVGADDGAAVFGSRTVPMTDDRTVEVGTLFGSVEVVVPDDAVVRTTGAVVFGSVECDDACDSDGTVDVEVRANGGFGSVSVVTESESESRRD